MNTFKGKAIKINLYFNLKVRRECLQGYNSFSISP